MIFSPRIRFLCEERFKGVIPEPYPASQFLPDWYKKLPHRTGNQGLNKGTVKRCAPFLDSLSAGFIIPLAGDVELVSTEKGSIVSTDSAFPSKIIGMHQPWQLGGEAHPSHPAQPLKFSNFWHIHVPAGWSVLFVPPLNRADPRFECFSAIVECDKFKNQINFPFVLKDPKFSGIIEQGTPLVQAIPFKRSEMGGRHSCGTLSKKDLAEIQKTKLKMDAHESYYRDQVWKKDGKSRCPFHRILGL